MSQQPGRSSARAAAVAAPAAGVPAGQQPSEQYAAGSETGQFTAINTSVFKDGFTPDALLTYLARDVLKQKYASRSALEGGTAPLIAQASLQQVQQLVDTLNKADEELELLHREVGKKVAHMQLAIKTQEATYQASIEEADSIVNEARTAFKTVETQSNHISQVGLRVGARLQTAHAVRSRALELVDLLSHLTAFSQLLPPKQWTYGPDLEYKSKLPRVFWDDKALAEAAGLARKLTALTAEAHNAQLRSRLVGADEDPVEGTARAPPIRGSLKYTTWQLASYCNWLEARVVSRFDAAMTRGSLKGLTDCAAIMAKFDAEKVLVERYVSALPVFREAAGSQAAGSKAAGSAPSIPVVQPPAGPAPAQVLAALAPFNNLCDMLQATFEAEAGRMCEVFTGSNQALQLLAGRMARERLAPALDTLLLPPQMDSDADGETESSDDDDDDDDDDNNDGDGGDDEQGEGSSHEERGSGAGGEVEHQIAAALGRGEPDSPGPAPLVRQRSKQNNAGRGWGRRAPHVAESPDLLAMRLHLLVKVHARVWELVSAIEAACSAAGVAGQLSLNSLRDGLFDPYLCNYPHPELRWLDMCYKILMSSQTEQGIVISTGKQLLSNNKDALARAAALSKHNEVVAASWVQLLYHGHGPFEEHPGSLLEQLAHYLIDGLEHSLDVADIRDPASKAKAVATAFHEAQDQAKAVAAAVAEATSKGKPPPAGLPKPPPLKPPITKQRAADLAEDFARTRLQPTFKAVLAAVAIMATLQEHYQAHVLPRVRGSLPDLAAASQGTILLTKAVEDACRMVLQRALDAAVIKAELTLLTEQQRTDFYTEPAATDATSHSGSPASTPHSPGAAYAGSAAAPSQSQSAALAGQTTPACMLVCAQLAALHREATACLEGANSTAFLQEVGSRMHGLLVNHMRQFKYSSTGALRWKADVTAYVELMSSWGVPGLRGMLQGVQALANVLVVPAKGLVALVDAQLRMNHTDALAYIALREDFHTAHVDGRSLQELFSAGGTTVEHIIGQTANS